MVLKDRPVESSKTFITLIELIDNAETIVITSSWSTFPPNFLPEIVVSLQTQDTVVSVSFPTEQLTFDERLVAVSLNN
jgi:hypothetical protein